MPQMSVPIADNVYEDLPPLFSRGASPRFADLSRDAQQRFQQYLTQYITASVESDWKVEKYLAEKESDPAHRQRFAEQSEQLFKELGFDSSHDSGEYPNRIVDSNRTEKAHADATKWLEGGYDNDSFEVTWREEPAAGKSRNLELTLDEQTAAKLAFLASRFDCTSEQYMRSIVYEHIQSVREDEEACSE